MSTASFINFLQYGQARDSGIFEHETSASFSLLKATLKTISLRSCDAVEEEKRIGRGQEERERTIPKSHWQMNILAQTSPVN